MLPRKKRVELYGSLEYPLAIGYAAFIKKLDGDPIRTSSVKHFITMNNDIIRRVGALHDMRIEDEHISAVLTDKETILPEAVKKTIRESAKHHAKDILDKLRELQVDLRSNPAVFIGGGSVLFREYLEDTPMVASASFIDNPNANAIGFRTMAEAQMSLKPV